MFVTTEDTHKEGFNHSLIAQSVALIPEVSDDTTDFNTLNEGNKTLLAYLDQQVKRLMLIHNHGDKNIAFDSRSYGMPGGDIT